MSCHDPIPSNSKHRKAPRSTLWRRVHDMLRHDWHERLTIDEHDAPSRPDQSIRSKPGRSDRSDLWLGMACHGLAWLGTDWHISSLIMFDPFRPFNPSGSLLPVKIMFELFSNFMFMVLLRIWNYTSLSHHETVFCSLFLHLLSDQGPIFPFCFYHQDR